MANCLLFAHRGLGEEKPEEELMGNMLMHLYYVAGIRKIFFFYLKLQRKIHVNNYHFLDF